MILNFSFRYVIKTLKYLGGYSVRVPPLPIPNREVKPDNADGTADCGRVGSRRFYQGKLVNICSQAFSFFMKGCRKRAKKHQKTLIKNLEM